MVSSLVLKETCCLNSIAMVAEDTFFCKNKVEGAVAPYFVERTVHRVCDILFAAIFWPVLCHLHSAL